MYFNIFPKIDIKDYYNHRLEYMGLKEKLEKEGVALLGGPRYSGKTSLATIISKEIGANIYNGVQPIVEMPAIIIINSYRKDSVNLHPLNNEMAMEFLRIGYKQMGIRVTYNEMKKAIKFCRGNMGCLTLYGYLTTVGELKDPFDRMKDIFKDSIKEEWVKILRRAHNPEAYQAVMLEAKGKRWSEIEESLSTMKINPGTIGRVINRLEERGLIYKHKNRYWRIPQMEWIEF